MAQYGSTLELPIKNVDAIVMLSMRWKKRPGLCQTLDTPGNTWLKCVHQATGRSANPSGPPPARDDWKRHSGEGGQEEGVIQFAIAVVSAVPNRISLPI